MMDTPILSLSDPKLLRDHAYIDGAWVAADDLATLTVVDPASGATLADVASVGAAETAAAIDAAAAAQPGWAALTARERGVHLQAWYDLMMAHRGDLARLLTAEQGKPLAEAGAEIAYGAGFVQWFAEEGRRMWGETIPSPWGDKRFMVLHRPIGVVGLITPWNFPAGMIARKAAPALAAGCAAVIKPAEQTPLTALALAELADRAGIPKGVLNVVVGEPAPIGEAMIADPRVRAMSFTGSTEVGKLLMRQAADTVKRVSLELGGNAPFIVFDDADLDLAVEQAMVSKFRNTGQTCVCANRILVQAGVHDAFVAKLAEKVEALKVGPGAAAGVQQGPLIDDAALHKIERLIDDAKAKGAEVVTGGARHALGGTYYRPTVLSRAEPHMDVWREEAFGPVAPVYYFTDEAEAIRLANDSEHGLAAYFFARDNGRIWRVQEALEFGLVGVNTGLMSAVEVPFGGMKQSGLGREGGRYGLEEFLEIKTVCHGAVGEPG